MFLWFCFFDMVKFVFICYYDCMFKGFGVCGGYGVMVDDIFVVFYMLFVFVFWCLF